MRQTASNPPNQGPDLRACLFIGQYAYPHDALHTASAFPEFDEEQDVKDSGRASDAHQCILILLTILFPNPAISWFPNTRCGISVPLMICLSCSEFHPGFPGRLCPVCSKPLVLETKSNLRSLRQGLLLKSLDTWVDAGDVSGRSADEVRSALAKEKATNVDPHDDDPQPNIVSVMAAPLQKQAASVWGPLSRPGLNRHRPIPLSDQDNAEATATLIHPCPQRAT